MTSPFSQNLFIERRFLNARTASFFQTIKAPAETLKTNEESLFWSSINFYFRIFTCFIFIGAAWSLYTLHLDHLEDPLTSFNMSLTELSWTKILGWSLYGLTVLPVVLGILVRLAWIRKGVPFLTVSANLYQYSYIGKKMF